jgi:hypothetical protein
MENLNLKGRLCSWATPKENGALFWNNGTYEGENETHFYFLKDGRLLAVLRASVQKIEFGGARQ